MTYRTVAVVGSALQRPDFDPDINPNRTASLTAEGWLFASRSPGSKYLGENNSPGARVGRMTSEIATNHKVFLFWMRHSSDNRNALDEIAVKT
jgi:hypothetical protein